MADASYVRASFLGGEVSQFAQGRTDRPEYTAGMSFCLNGFPIETGAWVRRPGFMFAQTTRNGIAGRVIKFDFQQNAAYNMEFTSGHLRFFTGLNLATTNDDVDVVSIDNATPAVVTLATPVTWGTTDQAFFSELFDQAPPLQNRVFSLTKIDTTHFSLSDPITGDLIDGSTFSFGPDGRLNRVADIPTPYVDTSWATLRSVQTENTSFLLQGLIAPQVVTVTRQPDADNDAAFALAPAVFNDGPYLDPFINGVQANPSAGIGIISLTLSFPAYNATRAYATGMFVTSAGINYVSLIDQNVGNVPAGFPAAWQPTSAGAAISPDGFQISDIGRLVRLFSEPALWVAGTVYAQDAVVAYNPNGLPGQTTYWTSLVAGNTGNIPGIDVKNWRVMAQGGTSSPALWTWGKIVSLLNIIDRALAGSVNIGNLTIGGGLAAAFDGILTQNMFSGAAARTVSGNVAAAPGQTYTADGFVGKDYSGATDQKISQAIVYPSADNGFAQGSYSFNNFRFNFSGTGGSVQLALRGKSTPPANSSDGTLLGFRSINNTTGPVTITSNDPVTAWKYLWIQVTAFGNNISSGVSSNFTITLAIAEVEYLSPAPTTTADGISVQILGPALLYLSAIREWRLGLYSNTTGWPSCGTYHEGRLWLSGVRSNRIDGSVSNGITGRAVDFAPTDQYGNVLASSAVAAVFNAPDTNPIFWMIPDQQGIICGTKAGEWLVIAPTSGPISPQNIAARRVTTIGCADQEPRRTEHTTVFVQKFLRKVMEYFPDVYSGKFTAPHLTFAAKHLTLGDIQEIAYQQELSPTVWVRVAGELRGCTYKRDTLVTSQGPSIVAWHQHRLGSGRTVESMTVGPSVGGNVDALAIVSRDPETNIFHVEVLGDILDEGSTLPQARYLDNAVVPSSFHSDTTTPMPYGGLTLNGLWHLNDKTVTAWLGGLDCGDYEVVDGSITVPYGDGVSAGTADGLFTADFAFADTPMLVGFSYRSAGQIVRPNSREETGARNGPGFGKIRRHQWYAVLLEGTQGVSFGATFDKLDPALFRDAKGTPLPIDQQFSGIWTTTVTDNYSFDGMLIWQVTRPYICNVVSIGGYIQTQDK